GAEVHRTLGELLDAAARPDRLVVDRDLAVLLVVRIEGRGVEGLGERRASTLELAAADVRRGRRVGGRASADAAARDERHGCHSRQPSGESCYSHDDTLRLARLTPGYAVVNGGTRART